MSSFSWPSTTGGSSSNASIGPNGSTIPSSATLVAGENPGGNLQPLQTDASGNLLVSLSGSGVEPIPVSQSGVWNITDITGTISLPTGASTAALQTTGNTSLASILANQTNGSQVTSITGTVPLPTGAATAANQTNASQKTQIVDGSGNVIASTSNALDVAITQPLPAGTNTIGFVEFGPDVTLSGINLTVRDTGSSTTTGAYSQIIITGTPTAGSAASFALGSRSTIRMQIAGTWTGTIQFETSFDGGITWYQASAFVLGVGIGVTFVVANAGLLLATPGATHIRARMVAPPTGTANVFIIESSNESGVVVANAIKVIDGGAPNSTNVLTIKGASTAPVAGDFAVVTVASPNSTFLGTVAAGTAGTQSTLTGGVFNTTLPTLTNGQQAARQVDSSGRLLIAPVTVQSSQGTLTDASGTTSGTPSTSTQIFAANASRKYLLIQNVSTTATIWINFTSAAVTTDGAYQLLPGGSIVQESSYISTEVINVISTVASVPFTAKQG